MRKYSVVSLFSGAGGLDLGFIQTEKYEIIFANEKSKPAAKTYSANIGLKFIECNDKGIIEATKDAILACDVAKVDFNSLKVYETDIIIGAPPCQDFSIARGPYWERRGIEVRRGRLYAHFVRALVALQPKIFVFENVPGLISANKHMAYKVILEDFMNLKIRWPEVRKVISDTNNNDKIEGYEIVFTDIVDFSKLGVPQRRKRLLIIGVRKDLVRKNTKVLRDIKEKLRFLFEGEKWLFRKYPLTSIEVFEGRPLNELGDVYRKVMKKWKGVWIEVGSNRARIWKEKVWNKLTFDVVKDYLMVNNIDVKDSKEIEDAFEQHELTLKELGYYAKSVSCLSLPDGTTEPPRVRKTVIERMRRIPPDENYKFVIGTPWEVEGKGISMIYRRLHPLKPSYTIAANGGGGTHGYHYDRDRATLTLRERARLQTFPDNFLFHGGKINIRSQIGEAVPPLATKRIAKVLADVLKLIM